MGLTRRGFLTGAAALAAIEAVSACGNDLALSSAPVPMPADGPMPTTPPWAIDGGATVSEQAVRGQQVQVADTVPSPPRNLWRPGIFVQRVAVDTPRMAFTFDDGPSPYNTHLVLEALARHGIKATFFLIGVNVRAWPDIARRIVDEGHEVGNHSVYHTPYRASSLAAQIGPNQNIIEEVTGVRPVANRAPGLTRGQVILDTCAAHGMYELHTSNDTNDWRSPRLSASALLSEFSRYDWTGDVALYHDGGNRRPTPDALPYMIDLARSRGMIPVTATELLNSGRPEPGGLTYDAGRLTQGADEHVPVVGTTCAYDARAEIERRLAELDERADPTLVAERNRLREILAEMDELETSG